MNKVDPEEYDRVLREFCATQPFGELYLDNLMVNSEDGTLEELLVEAADIGIRATIASDYHWWVMFQGLNNERDRR